ncbi:hypothetical protein N4G70_35410 [Streptomyces sp. ASQP_92]|uniref:hypothetical protein n=1 Tax=Streptomyces sp. ASQP_92 TaxID=2979116 RepID=UPI0021BF0610|nr:hypothetical protein [Streptomyces sp. ASQP_92]MCT9094098.1 hypothetical protein [Streptomyces sp. ASQP_92]
MLEHLDEVDVAFGDARVPEQGETGDDGVAVSCDPCGEGEGWAGVTEGIDVPLSLLRQQRDQTCQFARGAPVDLGIPGIAPRSAVGPE